MRQYTFEMNEEERVIALLALAVDAHNTPNPQTRHLFLRLVNLKSDDQVEPDPLAQSPTGGTAQARAVLSPPAKADAKAQPPDTEALTFAPVKIKQASGGKSRIVDGGPLGVTVSCWDAKFFDQLEELAKLRKQTKFYAKRTVKGDKTYLNIVGIA